MNDIKQYFEDFSRDVGEGWNRIWFTPISPLPTCVLRIVVGMAAIWFFVSFTSDLTRWFASDGLLPPHVVLQLQEARDGLAGGTYHGPSILFYMNDPTMLMAIHGVAIVCAVAMTIGFLSRGTTIATFVLVLCYVHRAPMISGFMDPILTFMLGYLCLAPTGRYLSLDKLLNTSEWFRKQDPHRNPQGDSISANIALRLTQIHLTMFYLMIGLSMAAGLSWWDGTSMWWLITRSESRLVDFTFLHANTYVINLWTHAVAVYTLAFPLLIWNRYARPILLVLSVPYWLSLGAVTGLVSYCGIMLIANIAFMPETWLQRATRTIKKQSVEELPPND